MGTGVEVEGSRARFVGVEGVKKLFVFGDSYVDAGNTEMGSIQAWKSPYGSTFPGQPTGRWSDGRVMSDVFGRFSSPKYIDFPDSFILIKSFYINLIFHCLKFR